METPTLVETVARAICYPLCPGAVHPCDRDGSGACSAQLGKCHRWRLYEESARNAISAFTEWASLEPFREDQRWNDSLNKRTAASRPPSPQSGEVK